MTSKNKNYLMMLADTEKAFDKNPASICDDSCQQTGMDGHFQPGTYRLSAKKTTV